MRHFLLATALVADTATATAQARATEVCARSGKAQIAGLFERWNTSLKTQNPEEALKNYAPDAVLLPTVSSTPRFTQEERRDYFAHFLEGKPVGQIDQRTIKLGCNDAIDTGLCTFTFGDGHQAHARYTFTYALRGGKWLISTHHSSAMPEKDAAAH